MSLQIKAARAGYQGDPGLWGFVKGVGKAAVGFATGGVGGAIAAVRPRSTVSTMPVAMPGSGAPAMFQPQNGQVAAPGILPAIQRFIPGGKTGMMAATNGKAPGGYHWNKTSYYTQAGFVPAGTKLVKNRRRNPGNTKAASRAMSRLTQSKNHMKMLNRVTIRKPDTCK